MNAHKVVVHVEQRNRVHVILSFLAESVSQASEAPHVHPHGEVLALDVAGRNMLLVGVAKNGIARDAKTLRRAVTVLAFRIATVNLDQCA